jgi:Flp pilus assembly protein CpaB
MAPGQRRGGRVFFLIAIVIVLLLVAAVVVIKFLPQFISIPIPGVSQPQVNEVTQIPTPTPPSVKVVVVIQPIPKGARITDGNVMLVDMPQTEYYTQGLFFTDTKDVLDKRARMDLHPGTPLSSALIVDKGTLPSFDIPESMVAISIPISRLTSVGFGLENGDHVNVIASILVIDIDPNTQTVLPNYAAPVTSPGVQGVTADGQAQGPSNLTISVGPSTAWTGRTELDPALNQPLYVVPSESQRPRIVSQTLIQDAIILFVGEFNKEAYQSGSVAMPTPTPAPTQEGGTAPPPAAPPAKPDMITLVVTPQDAVTLNYLILSGAKLNLVLRRAGDASRVQTEAVTLQFLMDQYGIPLPAKLPFGQEPRLPPTGLDYPPLRNGD